MALFAVKKATFSLQTTCFLSVSLLTALFKGSHKEQSESRKGQLWCNLEISLLVFLSPKTTADSVNKGWEGAGPGAPWGMDWTFCGQTSSSSWAEDRGRNGWRQKQDNRWFSAEGEGWVKNPHLFPFLAWNSPSLPNGVTGERLHCGAGSLGTVPSRHLDLACLCKQQWGSWWIQDPLLQV